MTTPQSIASEVQSLSPSAVIELFQLDTTPLGGDIIYFHAGTNKLQQNVVWQGQEYIRYPVQVTGFDMNAQGQLPRPKLSVSNFLSAITALLLQYDDLLGMKITRKRTLAKYLDAVNFPGSVNASADPDATFPDDIFFIDQKTSETRESVEFDLASAIDLAGIQIPRRQIVQNLCSWIYRGSECGYTDTQYFRSDDTSTDQSAQDVCGKRLTSCKVRFGSGGDLPFGGFPGAGLIR